MRRKITQRLFLAVFCLFFQTVLCGQTQKIHTLEMNDGTLSGSVVMNADALIDMQSSKKGLLLPRVALVDAKKPAPLTAHTAGMTVYNTATVSSTASVEGVAPGYYYNNGTKWVRLTTEVEAEWKDAADLIYAKQAKKASNDVVITDDGRIGIGTSNPEATLDVVAKAGTTDAQGILVPRLTAQQLLDMQVGADQEALLVYMKEPIPANKRVGAFAKVDNIGFYHYFADANNASNSYWKKILEVEEQRPIWHMVKQDGIYNDIAMNNYYKEDKREGKDYYDSSNFVLQNFRGTPTNRLPLPHDLSNFVDGKIQLGGLHLRAMLGSPHDNNGFAPELQSVILSGVSGYYFGLEDSEPMSGVTLFSAGGNISINNENNKRIDINTFEAKNEIRMRGFVHIGGEKIPTGKARLEVDGDVKATRFMAGETVLPVPDYVFETYYNGSSELNNEYGFMSLAEVEAFTKANNHLPGYESASAIAEKGSLDIVDVQLKNVEKIEELYLHLIEKEKEVENLKSKLQEQDERLQRLEKFLDK